MDAHVDLKNPIDVKLPDGKKLKATKLGNVKTYFENYHIKKKVQIERCLLCRRH